MAHNGVTSPSDLNEATSTEGSKRSRSCPIPKSWIIAAVLFYCASVVTVGLLAGLLPRRTQHITIYGTPTATSITTTADPTICIDDECNPRLLSNLTVHNYQLEYIYNNTDQTTAQGNVTIEFTLNQPITQLIYHSKRLVLGDPDIIEVEGNVYHSVSMRLYAPNDYISLRLSTNTPFPANRYKLVQAFVVNLTDGNVGFYQNIFKDGNETQ